MAGCEKILIAGFSGAGKSTLLKALAAQAPVGWDRFDDLDDLILRQHGRGAKTLAELISQAGWEKFRLWERQAFEGWLKEEEKGVLALGGGTLSPLVLELFGKHPRIKFIHLSIPFPTAWERLQLPTSEPRPLVQLGKAHMQTLYQERLQLFHRLPIQLDGLESPETNAKKIWNEFV
jgi:shikimate kinase